MIKFLSLFGRYFLILKNEILHSDNEALNDLIFANSLARMLKTREYK
jgi:hypothetical protein